MGKRRNRNKQGFSERVETVCGHSYATVISGAAAGSITISPSNAAFGTHLNNISDAFLLCRCVDLEIQVCTTAEVIVGVVAGNMITTPTSVSEASQVEVCVVNWAASTFPVKCHANRAYLTKSQVPWYKTELGAADTEFEVQGYIVAHAASSTTVNIMIRYVWEFTSWAAITNTPALAVPQKFEGSKPDLSSDRAKVLLERLASELGLCPKTLERISQQ